MKEVRAVLAEVSNFEAKDIEAQLVAFITAKEYGMGKVMNALRLTLMGVSNGPGVAEICEILGKEETLERINRAIAAI